MAPKRPGPNAWINDPDPVTLIGDLTCVKSYNFDIDFSNNIIISFYNSHESVIDWNQSYHIFYSFGHMNAANTYTHTCIHTHTHTHTHTPAGRTSPYRHARACHTLQVVTASVVTSRRNAIHRLFSCSRATQHRRGRSGCSTIHIPNTFATRRLACASTSSCCLRLF